ncbi:haloacid dehalogenase type II [Amycolatopsis azurea]|uniref:2-haloalkanoic acid dehalogenase n=1 Tax=Amycolatopsis azurea DSM 43854 TaxID=1238180 RepID=M2PYM9_9PSEU|nr:haloacid dehalogenase type II [Amycolatopsis azurea]EMD24785.1 2-haloalkanoic acid dehalogenase [Amycolatopsis azurea DSM 43854]OOC08272.1 haloacid dehalogenase, type II [Amycolatopsis azurea DSM 43854]
MQIDALVFDILGTLVDEPAGIRAAVGQAEPDADADQLVRQWLGHVATEQQRIVDGERPYAPSDVLDREAAQTDALASAGRRMPPWPDTVEGLNKLAEHYPLIGLSNASRTTLLRMNAYAGLRWHEALSAEEAQSYKPDPAVYELAVELTKTKPERLLMVAAHAWDLRGAQSVGLRTAYVARPIGDPPSETDRFDFYADDLADLAAQLAKLRM